MCRRDWKDLCLDPRFQDIPFKVELNGQGQIIMSPTRNYRGYYANRIARLLEKYLPDGEVIVECGVDTADGTKEADVAWLTREQFARMRDEFSCAEAPEICVEVLSPSNTREEMSRKRRLYLDAGAREYWLCDAHGEVEFFDANGRLDRSRMCPEFPGRVPE